MRVANNVASVGLPWWFVFCAMPLDEFEAPLTGTSIFVGVLQNSL